MMSYLPLLLAIVNLFLLTDNIDAFVPNTSVFLSRHAKLQDIAMCAAKTTPELDMMVAAFARMPDEKLRYKQLMFLAQKLAPMSDVYKTDANKVPGCLSTVHVHATLDENNLVQYEGDSDGLLTKGLVALLVRGLSGNDADTIQAVEPGFIEDAGIAASLTPGRNNGFLNMLATMKKQALALSSADINTNENDTMKNGAVLEDDSIVTGFDEVPDKPMYNAMMSTLITLLKPKSIQLIDNSSQHEGHAGSKGFNGESHFELEIVADCFENLALVKRHQLIYTLLGEIMTKIHALQIRAYTPAEAEEKLKA